MSLQTPSYPELSKAGQIRRLRSAVINVLREGGTEVQSCRVILHQHNTTFRVESKGGVTTFLRMSRSNDRSPDAVQDEIAWIHALSRDGHPVPTPIAWPSGQWTSVLSQPELGDVRILSRFDWVPGKLSKRPTSAQWFQIGETLARLHIHSLANPELGKNRWQVDAAVGNSGDMEESMRDCEVALGTEARTQLQKVWEEYVVARTQMGPRQLIHGDLHHWNVLFDGSDLTVVDFDDCGWAPALYDFVVPINELADIGQSSMEAELVAGYRSVRNIPGDLVGNLPILKKLRVTQLILWVLGERKNPGFADWWNDWCVKSLGELAS